MSIKSRLTGNFLARAFLLFVALGMVFTTWGVAVIVVTTMQQRPAPVAGTSPIQVLEAVRDETTLTAGSVVVSPSAQERVRKLGGWIQVLDPEGRVVYALSAPSTVPTSYAPGEVVYYRNKPAAIGQQSFYTLYSEGRGRLTWILGSEDVWKTPLQRAVTPLTLAQSVLILIAVMIAASLGIAWASSETLARPLVHVLEWLNALAAGDFAEPVDKRGQPASRAPDGSLRKPYRTYREVIGSLDSLTEVLGSNEVERERIEAAREEWIAGITHDLRTPLSSVRGYADLLGSGHEFTADETRQYAQTISAQAENMERLIEDFGLSFRLRADALPLDRERVDLVDVARDAAVALANDPRSQGRTVTFAGSSSGAAVPVQVDVRYVTRALANMLVNAVLHNPEGTTVTVSVERVSGWACVDVRDDGRGMDEATLSRLFDRYYRGTAAGGDAYGTGLGMAIARQLVEAHGGSVAVTSEVGRGTVVRVCLPLAE